VITANAGPRTACSIPIARGKGYGTIAQRLLVGYLFAHTPAHRIEADTELENFAEQRASTASSATTVTNSLLTERNPPHSRD
jgi:hypothetical protein